MIYRRGNVWWYEFAFQGQRIRESSKSESKTVAEALLARRIGETGLGIRPAQEVKKYRYEEARAALLADSAGCQPSRSPGRRMRRRSRPAAAARGRQASAVT